MNEEELIRNVNKYLYDTPKRTKICMAWVSSNCDISFQKGKLEQKKEELEFLLIMKEHIETNNCPLPTLRLNDRIKQLQKEIGGMK